MSEYLEIRARIAAAEMAQPTEAMQKRIASLERENRYYATHPSKVDSRERRLSRNRLLERYRAELARRAGEAA